MAMPVERLKTGKIRKKTVKTYDIEQSCESQPVTIESRT